MMIRACSKFYLKSLDSGRTFYCQVKSLFVVTVAVFLYAQKGLSFHPINISFVCFCTFFLPFFSFQFFITSENCVCLLMQDILRRYLT